jgi:hypothetical protein
MSRTYPKGVKRSRPCFICLSPFKNEVVSLRKKGVPALQIYNKLAKQMRYDKSEERFADCLTGHIRDKHLFAGLIIPENATRAATLENFAQKMLEMGMEKISTMDSSQVAIKDVVSSQKLLLDSKKLKLTEDAMMGMLAKLFAPPKLQVIEGETVDGKSEVIGA